MNKRVFGRQLSRSRPAREALFASLTQSLIINGSIVTTRAKAKAVISNDSGPMHIAAALGVPVVALFGPTDPEKTGPYGWKKNKNLKVIRTSVPCSPCFKKKCKDPVCMSGITVEKVLEEIREYL